MYEDDKVIHVEKTDQCYTCTYFNKGTPCPLLEALSLKVVALMGDINVTNCGFFIKHERRLKVVK